jgi:GntP family gluconate:H+ symporter
VVLKVAQGSGTVSIVVTSSMMASIVADVDLGYHLVYLVMAIGCGSKVGSWMNDSGFWIVCQMSGFTEIETLKTWTLLLVIMGLVGFAMTLLLAVFLPHGLPFFG